MKEQPIEVDGERYVGTTVSMGNPHLVIFVNDIEAIDLTVIGPKLENHPLFPDRTNVEHLPSIGRGKDKDARMGTGFGRHPSLWNRSLCHSRSRFPHRTCRKKINTSAWMEEHSPLNGI